MTDEAVPAEDEQWSVYIEWIGRNRVNNLTPRQLARRARRAYELTGNLLEGEPGLASDLYVSSFVVVAALLLLIALGPAVLAVLLGVLEVALLFAIIIGALVWRFILRRPWRVVAVHESGAVWSWHQVGWRRAKELVHDLQLALDAGVDPATHGTGSAKLLGSTAVEHLQSPPVWTQRWFRWTTRAAAVALLGAGVISVLVRYVA